MKIKLKGIGVGLLASGVGLGLLFGAIDVAAEGPAGITVAIFFGLGLCVLLLEVLNRVFSGSGALRSDVSEFERPKQLVDLKVRRAKLAIGFSVASSVLALVLFFVGIPVAFIGFNFASGTNDIGFIMSLTGIVVGVIAISSGFVSLLLGWIAGNASGKFHWFFAALALPVFQSVAYLVGTYATK